MLELYDLFEREQNSDVLALTNLGKRISGKKNILIMFQGGPEIVFTDGRYIYLPIKYKKEIRNGQGLVAHEAGHIGYGSFELAVTSLIDMLSKKYKISPMSIKVIINILEDVRINLINKKKFPGFYRNLRNLTREMIPQMNEKIKNTQDILLYLNLFMEDYQDFQSKPSFKTVRINDEDWESFSVIKKFFIKSLSPGATIIASDLVCAILKKYYMSEQLEKLTSVNNTHGEGHNMIQQLEQACAGKKTIDKTPLDWISEEIIKNLRSFELKPEDLTDIMNQLKELKKHVKDLEQFGDCNDPKHRFLSKKSIFNKNIFCKDIFGDLELRNPKIIFKEGVKTKENENKSRKPENKTNSKKSFFEEIIGLIKKSDEALKERLNLIERGDRIVKLGAGGGIRKVTELYIERAEMNPIGMSYKDITTKYATIIKKMKMIFAELKNHAGFDNSQRKGRLNNKFIKAVTSEYKYKLCFTRKVSSKDLRLLVMVDISGSMNGQKLRAAKTAVTMLCEALEGLAKIRIVLFTGDFHVVDILLKDFEEKNNAKKIDRFGLLKGQCENIDGVSIKHEARKLEKNDFIIVISDGQPAAKGNYGVYDAIPDIHEVRKFFKVFAFSIDAQGEYLNQLYGKDWILAGSRNQSELGQKLIKMCQVIVREFYK